ncbi:MAG: alpha/beta hydrolase fold domain-containing protein [Defluviicoccus sp.]|nr:MAG: alpha/beta hydrolase fold domain-containing protein [Defluviicoccus sp.]
MGAIATFEGSVADRHLNGGVYIVNSGRNAILEAIPLHDPRLSPVYVPIPPEFPPSILVAGTRDLLLSGTVRRHRKLVTAGVEAELHMFEALWHDFPLDLRHSRIGASLGTGCPLP